MTKRWCVGVGLLITRVHSVHVKDCKRLAFESRLGLIHLKGSYHGNDARVVVGVGSVTQIDKGCVVFAQVQRTVVFDWVLWVRRDLVCRVGHEQATLVIKHDRLIIVDEIVGTISQIRRHGLWRTANEGGRSCDRCHENRLTQLAFTKRWCLNSRRFCEIIMQTMCTI